MNNEIAKIKQLYIFTEMNYIDNHPDINEDDLFPINWYSIKDYVKKIEILCDAIKNNTLVKDTIEYKEYIGIDKIRKY